MDSSKIDTILDRKYQMTDTGKIDTIRELYTVFSPNVNFEALKNTDFFPAMEKMMEVVLDVPDERSEQVLNYWRSRGMRKEFHGYDTPTDWDGYAERSGYRWKKENHPIPQNDHMIWTSLVPESAYDPANKDRKYPLVVVLHGAGNNIFLAEGWGFGLEAAKREWIVIFPSLEVDEFILNIIAEAKKTYPVDDERIYVTGFSYGGWSTNRLGNQHPELFAAVAPCGAPMDNGFAEASDDDREAIPPFDGKPRALEQGIYMPIINIYGQCDGERYPVYNFHGKRFGLSSMETPEDVVNGINSWLRVNKAPEIRIDDVMALKDKKDRTPEEADVGLPADSVNSYQADGVQYHLLGFRSEDGIERVKFLAEMNIPHWPTPEMAKQIFAFFDHFKRDARTKESIYVN